ncbi:glucose 1-dehydrogenase [Aquisalimonas sp. 2447]|uniref:glucose 1-dehydrogenase n=1 Tax=Aquisalimonas sp. 2447 TaxID=2740807 RepID=UPI00143252E6|nr:glucose 1-dehydrogenase [Aquisalimonas sp. 2447]QIT56051.1 glucose 1-dehydrogenase [Aquisalimonas sp. 2447]
MTARAGFAGKAVLVTGGASGIGRAVVERLAADGARLVIADILAGEGESVAEQIRQAGGEAVFVHTDVRNGDQVQAMVATALDTYGRLDCAVNNAGVEHGLQALADFGEEDWERVQDINLKGVWLCLKHELPVMVRQGQGSIVNLASVAGLVGAPLFGPYVASKHGVVGLTRTAALEYGRMGVRVNAVCPSAIRTEMFERSLTDRRDLAEKLVRNSPMRRLGEPAEVAEAVVWLCSDAASFVNGHALTVDGGMTAQ